MKTKIALILSVLIITVTSMFYGGRQISARLFANPNSRAAPTQLPDYILYESLFRMNLSFHRKAMEQELTGQPATSLKTYFKRKGGLSDAEDEILYQTSLEYLQEIQPINDQATQILAQLREQFPDGYVPQGQEVPPPPATLAALQAQRNSVALSNRDKLAQALGPSRFGVLDNYVKQDFAANFQALGTPRQ